MEFSNFHDLIRRLSVFQISISDAELASLPSWLAPPLDGNIASHLRYLTDVAEFLQQEEENSMVDERNEVEEVEEVDDDNDEIEAEIEESAEDDAEDAEAEEENGAADTTAELDDKDED